MEGLHAERQVKFVKSAGIVASSWLRSWAKQSGTHDIFRKDSLRILSREMETNSARRSSLDAYEGVVAKQKGSTAKITALRDGVLDFGWRRKHMFRHAAPPNSIRSSPRVSLAICQTRFAGKIDVRIHSSEVKPQAGSAFSGKRN